MEVMEKITLEELPFTFPLLEMMKNDSLTIDRLKGEFGTYYYLTSSRIHQTYSYNGESAILLTEFHMSDVMSALDNPAFAEKLKRYLGTAQVF